MDAIDCMVMNNDLALENDVNKRRESPKNKSRRDQRSYESSNSRPPRRSSPPPPPPPPPVNRKRPPSPVSSSSSRSRNHHSSSSQKHRRNSSPSPPFITPKYHQNSSSSPHSSRHHQSSRSTVPTKRSYSPADSSRDRRQPTSRSRTDFSSDTTAFVSNSTIEQIKLFPKQDKNDLSFISEDESTKKSDIRNSTAIVQSSPVSINHNSQSAPNLNESLLETSTIPVECELSLFAKSTISNANTSTVLPSGNNFMQTLDAINKYKSISENKANNSNPLIEIWLKEIPAIIQRQIDLQKTELDIREREIKLRELEIAEKEKHFNNKSTENTTNTESIKTPIKSENNIHQDMINISPEESVVKTISTIIENSNPTTITRKTGGKSRFSPIETDRLLSLSTDKPIVEHSSIEFNDNQSTKIPLSQENLSVNEPILHPYSTELKVTSSSTSRKVEIQTGNHDTTVTKSSTQDLRLTLSKNRTKYSSNDDEDQTIEISPNSDDKQSNHDYQSQRSITSTPIESNSDDRRRQQQQTYPYNNQRSYNSGSSSKYGSKQKRSDNSDLRSRLVEQKNPKSSRSTYKTNH